MILSPKKSRLFNFCSILYNAAMFRVLVEVVSVGDDKARECEAAG